MKKIKSLGARLANYKGLNYSLFEFFKLVIFRSFLYSSLISKLKPKEKPEVTEISIAEIKIIVISLVERKDRREKISRGLISNNIPFDFFDVKKTKSLDSIPLNNFSKKTLKFLPPGNIGCLLAHSAVLELFLNLNFKYCLILEDDVIVDSNFKVRLTMALKKVPKEFDIFYLASGNRTDFKVWISNNLYKPSFPRRGTYSYVVSRAGVVKITNNLFPVTITKGCFDTIIGRLISKGKLNAYHCYPNLCNIDLTSKSDLKN